MKNTKAFRFLIPILLSVCFLQAQPEKLIRRGMWEARFEPPSEGHPGAELISMETGSPLQEAGFREGDLLVRVNGIHLSNPEVWEDVYRGLKGGIDTQLELIRGAEYLSKVVKFRQRPVETHAEIDTSYESVTSAYGIRHRTIVTKPRISGKQPAIMVLDGLSCSSIEVYPGRNDNWGKTLTGIIEDTGMVVMRVEKAGVGDSEGACSCADFHTDLAGYEAALQSLLSKDYVDSSRIVVYGSSMGSALAPYLANKYGLSGVISDGTFFKTWYEHMLEIERRIRQFEGDSESLIAEKMNKYYIPLYHGVLIQKKSFEEVIASNPALEAYNYHSPRHMYGRPVSYYHQLQDFDLAGAWENLKAPVRILRGTNDWIMSASDNAMIIEILERRGHQDHLLVTYPGLDHWNTIHETAAQSYSGQTGTWDPETLSLVVGWARELAGLSR